MSSEHRESDVLTVPNVVTVVRLVASLLLPWLAWAGRAEWFIGLFLALVMTDWLDGKLAILLDQRTTLGARLDSVGDAVLYACLLIGVVWLQPAFLRSEAILVGAMLGSYAVTVIVTLIRFQRLPAYHTRAAKTCWLLTMIGALLLLAGGPVWPARIALIAVIIANAEATVISFVLKDWRTDVPSLWHATRFAREGR
jgi:CDP-diacylglycerol--glycerol-3-phosphate 3-phosphatidyltransferase